MSTQTQQTSAATLIAKKFERTAIKKDLGSRCELSFPNDYTIPTQSGYCVYVIQNELGVIKVGFSYSPKSRLHSLAYTSGLRITKAYLVAFDKCHIARQVERNLLNQFKKFKTFGEWLLAKKLTFDMVCNALDNQSFLFEKDLYSDNSFGCCEGFKNFLIFDEEKEEVIRNNGKKTACNDSKNEVLNFINRQIEINEKDRKYYTMENGRKILLNAHYICPNFVRSETGVRIDVVKEVINSNSSLINEYHKKYDIKCNQNSVLTSALQEIERRKAK